MARQRSTAQAANSGPDQSRKKQLRRLALFAAAFSLLLLALTLFASYRQGEMNGAPLRARKEHEHSAQATPTPQLSEQALKNIAWDPGSRRALRDDDVRRRQTDGGDSAGNWRPVRAQASHAHYDR
jgi:cytochrome c-type biogenesis protein CcmH/NrfG